MAKAGMRRPNPELDYKGPNSSNSVNTHKNDISPVPEIQGKEKTGKKGKK